MSVLVGDEWVKAAKGSFVLLPGGIHTISKTGEVSCRRSISRCLVRSSLKCQALLSGSPRTRRRTQVPSISF